MGGDSGEWNSSDFEMDSDGGYPFAGEHYGVAGTPVPSRSIEGWYPGARARVAERAVCCVLRAASRAQRWYVFGAGPDSNPLACCRQRWRSAAAQLRRAALALCVLLLGVSPCGPGSARTGISPDRQTTGRGRQELCAHLGRGAGQAGAPQCGGWGRCGPVARARPRWCWPRLPPARASGVGA